MKQVGIIVFLAHIGWYYISLKVIHGKLCSYVPAARGTRIGLTDKILTRISTAENLAKVRQNLAVINTFIFTPTRMRVHLVQILSRQAISLTRPLISPWS
jgi:UDP-2,3-diacylglucosamine pyrophosphatase LpxH